MKKLLVVNLMLFSAVASAWGNYDVSVRKKYLLTIPNYFDFVKKTTSFYLSAPFYKQKNVIDSVIDLLKEKHGFD